MCEVCVGLCEICQKFSACFSKSVERRVFVDGDFCSHVIQVVVVDSRLPQHIRQGDNVFFCSEAFFVCVCQYVDEWVGFDGFLHCFAGCACAVDVGEFENVKSIMCVRPFKFCSDPVDVVMNGNDMFGDVDGEDGLSVDVVVAGESSVAIIRDERFKVDVSDDGAAQDGHGNNVARVVGGVEIQ